MVLPGIGFFVLSTVLLRVMISRGFVVISISSILYIISVPVFTGVLIIIVIISSEIPVMILVVVESGLVFDNFGVSVS